MSSLPSKLYHVKSSCGCFHGVFSSKVKLFDALMSAERHRPYFINDYRSLSEVLRLNRVFRTETLEGYLTITRFTPNSIVLDQVELPPFNSMLNQS